jgi:hypothetical protein
VLDLTRFSIEGTPFRVIFYFLVVLLGIFLGSRNEKIQYRGLQDYCFLLASIAVIYGHKFLMQHGRYDYLQFVQHLAAFPMLYYFLKISKSNFVSKTIMGSRYLGTALTFISAATLEVFMVNNTIDFLGPKLGPFPINAIALLTINLALAVIILYGAKPVSKIFSIGSAPKGNRSPAKDREMQPV